MSGETIIADSRKTEGG